MTDYAARLAALQEAETRALDAVSSAATALEKKRTRNDTLREKMAGEEADLASKLEAAQAGYVDAVGADRAATVLGIRPGEARALVKNHRATAAAQKPTTSPTPDDQQHDQHGRQDDQQHDERVAS